MFLSPKEHLPAYHRLSRRERFWLRTCFRFTARDKPVGHSSRQKPSRQRLEESAFFLKKAFGASLYEQLAGQKVLDFGCGEGYFAWSIARAVPSAQVWGVDMQPRFKRVKEQARDENQSNLHWAAHNTREFPAQSFDYILSHDSFEHFENPASILQEMTRLLRPGGIVLIKFGPTWMGPYGRHMFNVFRKDRPWLHLILPEKSVMRIYSVIKRREVLLEHYKDYPDGLNKMTVGKARRLLSANEGTRLRRFEFTHYLQGHRSRSALRFLLRWPLAAELLSKEVVAELEKPSRLSANSQNQNAGQA